MIGRYKHLTSKPIEPTPSTLKADLAVFVNSNMLVTKIKAKMPSGCVSSTSASKFEFLELPVGERVAHNLKLNPRVVYVYVVRI